MKQKIIIPVLLCLSLLLTGCGASKRIRAEIFVYVLQNRDEIQLDAPYGYQSFEYIHTGSDISSVDYVLKHI